MNADALAAAAFLGLIAAVGIYHLLMYAVLGDVEFVSYAAYLGALTAFEIARSWWATALLPASVRAPFFWWSFALLAVLGYVLFRSFLALPRRRPLLHRAFLFCTAVTAAGALVAPWGGPRVATAVEIVALAVLVIALVTVVDALRSGLRVARFFGIAYAGLFAGALAHALYLWAGGELGIATVVGRYGIELGSGFQALTLALGLADRIVAANEERDRAQRRTIEEIGSLNVAYARFVPRAFLDLLGARDVRDLRLGDGVEREMTVLFSDVRAFTTFAEGREPRDVFGFVNALLGRTGPVVREHGGIVDKYVGDAIAAFFPSTADDALRAAIGLHRAVDALNAERAGRGEPPVAIGVGVHRGPLMLGTIGEAERMDGTVIADTVNVASRVEGLTKHFGVRVLTTDAVLRSLVDPAAFETRFLGRVAVKGTISGVGVHEVVAAEPAERRAARARTNEAFVAAVDAFAAGRFDDATTGFARVAELDPDDGPAGYLLTRSSALASSSEGWTGIDVATEK